MTAAAFALHDVAGFPPNPQSVGQIKVVVKDIVWTSAGANYTADATIEEEALGLVTVFGAIFLGDVGAQHAGTDTVGTLDVAVGSDSDVAVSGLSAAGAALDLDSTDVAAARVAFLGV